MTTNQRKECLICWESFKRMISLEYTLNDCKYLTVGQVLEELHFVTGALEGRQMFCFICLTKIQSVYVLKTKCQRIEEQLKSIPENPLQNLSTIPTLDTLTNNEITDSRENKICKSAVPTTIDYSVIKSEIDIDDGILIVKNENQGIDKKVKKKHKKAFVCPICHKSFTRKSSLGIHTLIHTAGRPHVCDVCNKSFTHSTILMQHKRIHANDNLHACDVCNKKFYQMSNLIQHKLIHRDDRPLHVCDVCNKSFKALRSLNAHKRIHSDEKPYSCDVCNKLFPILDSLKKHKKVIHTETPYVCEVCNKSFNRLDSLVDHRRIHTGERPYVCDVCQKAFKTRSNFRTHMLIHFKKKIVAA